jgi:hypothetical protein
MKPELEKLVDMALADKVLTEKERQVLFKKAQEMGIDLDEFEVYLDGRLQIATQATQNSSAPKSEKLGEVRKCPGCGAIVPPLKTACVECGLELRNSGVSSAMSEFQERLQRGDTKQQLDTIKTFAVPNNKEDMIEFLTMAIANAQQATDRKLQEAWLTKADNVIMKMRLLVNEKDPSVVSLATSLTEAKRSVRNQRFMSSNLTKLGIVFLTLVFLCLGCCGYKKCSDSVEETKRAAAQAEEEAKEAALEAKEAAKEAAAQAEEVAAWKKEVQDFTPRQSGLETNCRTGNREARMTACSELCEFGKREAEHFGKSVYSNNRLQWSCEQYLRAER